MLSAWSHLFVEYRKLRDIELPLGGSNRNKYSAISTCDHYIALGSNLGNVYLFYLSSAEFIGSHIIDKGSVHLLSFSPNSQRIAIATSGGVAVYGITRVSPSLRLDRLRLSTEHRESVVTALCWDDDSSNVYIGDERGKVTVAHVPNSLAKDLFTSPTDTIISVEHPVVQLFCDFDRLLISTTKAAYLCYTKQRRFTMIGTKPRDGNYGSCFLRVSKDQDPVVYCARPGSRLWEVSLDGVVISTHQFKPLFNINPLPIITQDEQNIDIPERSSDALSGIGTAFSKLLVSKRERHVISLTPHGLMMLNPPAVSVVCWTNQITSKAGEWCDWSFDGRDLYLLSKSGFVKHIAILPVTDAISSLLTCDWSTHVVAQLLKVDNQVSEVMPTFDVIQLKSLLKHELSGELRQHAEQLLEAQRKTTEEPECLSIAKAGIESADEVDVVQSDTQESPTESTSVTSSTSEDFATKSNTTVLCTDPELVYKKKSINSKSSKSKGRTKKAQIARIADDSFDDDRVAQRRTKLKRSETSPSSLLASAHVPTTTRKTSTPTLDYGNYRTQEEIDESAEATETESNIDSPGSFLMKMRGRLSRTGSQVVQTIKNKASKLPNLRVDSAHLLFPEENSEYKDSEIFSRTESESKISLDESVFEPSEEESHEEVALADLSTLITTTQSTLHLLEERAADGNPDGINDALQEWLAHYEETIEAGLKLRLNDPIQSSLTDSSEEILNNNSKTKFAIGNDNSDDDFSEESANVVVDQIINDIIAVALDSQNTIEDQVERENSPSEIDVSNSDTDIYAKCPFDWLLLDPLQIPGTLKSSLSHLGALCVENMINCNGPLVKLSLPSSTSDLEGNPFNSAMLILWPYVEKDRLHDAIYSVSLQDEEHGDRLWEACYRILEQILKMADDIDMYSTDFLLVKLLCFLKDASRPLPIFEDYSRDVFTLWKLEQQMTKDAPATNSVLRTVLDNRELESLSVGLPSTFVSSLFCATFESSHNLNANLHAVLLDLIKRTSPSSCLEVLSNCYNKGFYELCHEIFKILDADFASIVIAVAQLDFTYLQNTCRTVQQWRFVLNVAAWLYCSRKLNVDSKHDYILQWLHTSISPVDNGSLSSFLHVILPLMSDKLNSSEFNDVLRECKLPFTGQLVGLLCYAALVRIYAKQRQQILCQAVLEHIDAYMWSSDPKALLPMIKLGRHRTHIENTAAERPSAHWGVVIDLKSVCTLCGLDLKLNSPVMVAHCGHAIHESCMKFEEDCSQCGR